MMFCANCKKDMTDSKTTLELLGKEGTVEVMNVPCSVCPSCSAQVVDGVTMTVVQKAAKKCKDTHMDFNKMGGVGISVGKFSL